MITLAALILSASIGAPAFERSSRAWLAEIELAGPIADVVLDLGAAGETRLSGTLLAGETRRLVVPLPARSADERFTPAIRNALSSDHSSAQTQGAVRFVRWLEPPASDLARLSPGLRARARPPVAPGSAAPSTAALLALGALGLTALGLGSRARAALFIAIPGVVVLWLLEPVRTSELAAHVTIVEADAASATWLEVEAACDRIDFSAPIGSAQIEVEPPDARLVWRVVLEGEPAFELSGRDVVLYRLSVLDPGQQPVALRQNRWAPLSETWVRDAGEWRAHGPWPLDSPLPPALDPAPDVGAHAPPGWLASGLPQGPTILIARVSPGAGPASASARGEVWLRLANLE